ncbi:BTAD domain-containing putative transcriptional regulator [Streptomyces sp. cg40]|uniref:AfsR/SARP family transcriptional regulator n=1 Tax=Streptomyces sp. cg40 TaxID=3419764 RepID=UPI003D0754A9
MKCHIGTGFVHQNEAEPLRCRRSPYSARTRGWASMVLVQLLGPVEYRGTAESQVELGQNKQRCIFAMLAVHANEVVTPDELINWSWEADPPASARNMIHTYISRLRSALESAAGGQRAVLRRRHGGYALEVDPDAIDLHRFRRIVASARVAGTDARTVTRLLREALGNWHGRPLGGVTGEWAARTRSLLEQEHLSALVECHEGELGLGGSIGLLDELHSLADLHPENELVIRNLMTGLHRSGRRTEAIETYEALRRRLTDRLGVDPARQTKDLHATILRADPDLVAAGPRADTAPSVPRQLPRSIRCVGREQELAMLDGSLTAAGGHPVTRVIEGPSGIGKTALAVQWAHRVAHRFPDGQVFMALHGSGTQTLPGGPHLTGRTPAQRGPAGQVRNVRTALSGHDVLRFVLRSLGVTVPREPTELVSFGQGVLKDLRVLVLLDDLASAEQLEVLLPGLSSGVLLVTTRDAGRLTGVGGLRSIGLQKLSVLQARRMLAGILGEHRVEAEPGAVIQIIELCDRFPRALSAAAEQALIRPRLPLTDLAAAMTARAG